MANSLDRIGSDKDPTYKFGLVVELLRTSVGAGLAAQRRVIQDMDHSCCKLLVDMREAQVDVPVALEERHEELKGALQLCERVQALAIRFLDDLAVYVRSPRYDPDQPLGNAMMQEAASDFVRIAEPKPAEPMAALAAQMIGDHKPTQEEQNQHKMQLLEFAHADIDRIYEQALRERSMQVCQNPYWFGK